MIEKKIAAEAAAAEQDADAPIRPGSRIRRGHARTRVLQVRLNEDEAQRLDDAAQQRGIPVSTLARTLLLKELTASGESPRATIARIRADLDELESNVA